MVENLIATSDGAALFWSGLFYLCFLLYVLPSLSWLSNGGLNGQFDHDLIDMAKRCLLIDSLQLLTRS